jgi:hypothetical protein
MNITKIFLSLDKKYYIFIDINKKYDICISKNYYDIFDKKNHKFIKKGFPNKLILDFKNKNIEFVKEIKIENDNDTDIDDNYDDDIIHKSHEIYDDKYEKIKITDKNEINKMILESKVMLTEEYNPFQ